MRGMIGAMTGETPAERAGQVGESGALGGKPRLILVPNGFDATNEGRRLVLQTLEPNSAFERQSLLGRIEHLKQMPAQTARRIEAYHLLQRLDRSQKIRDQDQTGM